MIQRFLGSLAVGLILLAGPAMAKERLAFSGGPEGGTFQVFSNGISIRLSKALPEVEVSNSASAGSLENLRRVNSGEADFGIVFAGDLHLGRRGQLTRDPKHYEKALVLGYLYGAPAHLVVLADSKIRSVDDLAGKRVAVGGAGSGAASAAQRYFTALGLWDRIKVEFLGYSKAASALGDGLVDAFWVLAGPPNASVIQASASQKVRFLDLVARAEGTDFFATYPFYEKADLPAGTYRGQTTPVASFQDSALWVARAGLSPARVEAAVAEIFSPTGLAFLVKIKSTAKGMSIEAGLKGALTPVHPGAEVFWRRQGVLPAAAARP